MISNEDARRRVQEFKGARQRWLCALHLLAHQESIPGLIAEGKWEELCPLREFVERGIPKSLKPHDPPLHQLLTKQLRQLKRSRLDGQVEAALAVHKGIVVPFDQAITPP